MIALDDLRAFAREAFGQCRLTDAAEAASAILAMGGADDFLFAGLIHDTAGRIADGLRVLRDGLSLYPDNASLHENLAVLLLRGGDTGLAIEAFQTAAALGSDSPNVHDGLCDAYQRIGRLDLAVEAGRRALRAKDRRFGGSVPLVAMPHGRPPPFRGGRPERNVIAYALWGDNPRYHVPLMENVRIRPHLFPDWSIRVYHDETVDPGYAAALAALGAQLQPMARSPGVPAHRALLWRFEVIADPDVERFLIRDADSLLTVKERVAVDAWLQSDRHFHVMRDWLTHTDLVLAGMWGGVGGILPPPDALLRAFAPWRIETDHLDQDLLSVTVWPAIRRNVLIHDSIFHPCLGSVVFPPFGALPAGHHIGQNCFLNFIKPR